MRIKLFGSVLLVTLLLSSLATAQDSIVLPKPDFSKGKNVLQAIKDRKSERVYGLKDLSSQQLSEVLWVAAGINRPSSAAGDKPGRTTPSSHNDQSIDTYAFTKTGVYKYDPQEHRLNFLFAGDHRGKSGLQSYVSDAPLNLIFVADMSRMSSETGESMLSSAYMDVGHMSQNIYIYGASAGLNVICRASIDQDGLRELLQLSEYHKPLLGMTVGLPK